MFSGEQRFNLASLMESMSELFSLYMSRYDLKTSGTVGGGKYRLCCRYSRPLRSSYLALLQVLPEDCQSSQEVFLTLSIEGAESTTQRFGDGDCLRASERYKNQGYSQLQVAFPSTCDRSFAASVTSNRLAAISIKNLNRGSQRLVTITFPIRPYQGKAPSSSRAGSFSSRSLP